VCSPPSLSRYTQTDLYYRADTASFPTPYAFSSAEQDAALAKRAARFAKPSESSYTGPSGVGVGGWFEDDEGDVEITGVGGTLGARLGLGGVKKRLKGGLGVESVMEVDPVRELLSR
jgi:hypothetical protein